MATECVAAPRGVVRPAVLLTRENRYRARVSVDAVEVAAHVPNPGRMLELLQPGCELHVVAQDAATRRTAWDVVAARLDTPCWVCVDNRLGGRLARQAIELGQLPELGSYTAARAEVTCGDSRLDFLLETPAGPHWVELKSCTLIEEGCGRFPDAPTLRGTRHVNTLAERVRAGEQASVLFLVQRPDAVTLGPRDATDPVFGDALRRAAAAGVRVLARTSTWTTAGLRLGPPVPVVMDR